MFGVYPIIIIIIRINGFPSSSPFGVGFQFHLTTCVGSHGLLQQGNPEYDVKRRELYDYYHPLEISPSIPIEQKAKLMEEWYMMQSLIIGYYNFHVHWNDLFISYAI